MAETPRYKRVLLKISGEALMGDLEYGLDSATVDRVAGEVKAVHDMDVQVCLVIGGGNIFRGLKGAASGMERATADYMGMLATVINALAIQDAVERIGGMCRVMSAIRINQVCEDYIRRRAVRHLEKGRVVVFGSGTGNPFFTTDSAASLRAVEINADLMLKATKVDGVYDSDPKTNPDAVKYDRLSYDQVLDQRLGVMDQTAIVLCRDHRMPLQVYNINEPGHLKRIVLGDLSIGTTVHNA